MLQELLTYFLPVAKFILAAALMVVFYNLLYKEKTTFNRCRIYLLSIALVSLLLSQFNIVVYTPQARIVEVPASISGSAITSETMLEQPMNVVSVKAVEKPTFMERLSAFLTIKNILLTIYSLITIGLLVSLFIQLFQILATKRKGKVTLHNGYKMVVSPGIPTPFSFFKSIFIGENLLGSKLELILKHEQWHIKHLHYLDVLMMEILVRIFWFNPVLWWVRKELRNVSEFQADRSVLDEGHDLYHYQTIIMEEVMEHNPYLANGFNNSFTKKRFIMMKNKCQIRLTTLRRVLILPFLVGVFSMLSFSVGKSQVKYVNVDVSDNELVRKAMLKDSVISEITTKESNLSNQIDGTKPFKNQTYVPVVRFLDIFNTMNFYSSGLFMASVELDRLAKMKKPSYDSGEIKKVFELLKLKIVIAKTKDFATLSNKYIASITSAELKNSAENFRKIKNEIDALSNDTTGVDKSYTLKKLMMSILQDNFVSNAYADVMSSANGLPVSVSEVRNSIDETAKVSNEANSENKSKDSNQTKERSIKDVPTKVVPILCNGLNGLKKYGNENFIKDAYTLTSKQIEILDIPPITMSSIYKIKTSQKETKVTISMPIIFDFQWFVLSDGFRIIDTQTKEEYVIRKADKNIPLNTILYVPNCKDKQITITLVFPPLKESVKIVDIIESNSAEATAPRNSGNLFWFLNIPLRNYLPSDLKTFSRN